MMLFGRLKALQRINGILGWMGGGVYKRIDENRELLELLRREVPDLVANHPEIVHWLQAHDDFFCGLETAMAPKDAQFHPRPQNLDGRDSGFPRPWPGDDADSARRQMGAAQQKSGERRIGPDARGGA